MAGRRARVERRTAEVAVTVELDLDGAGAGEADTGVPFLDHMLAQLGRHARFDLRVTAKGDLEVDAHHTVEDTGIAIGQALAQALGDKAGVRRFGDALVPLDEARARAAVDLSGRPYLLWDVEVGAAQGELGSFDPRQARHLLEALVANARCTVHVVLEAGDLPHHCLEACFKALARALGDACTPDPRAGSGSTKGTLA
ncbi:MAG TPA: imidazoleglycerol-phosphate dehydratase HisB [Actinomycetota bacterium]|jgi:imidazoleglycerol-phosphate dehydratase|nr:imidazoleglycerol-phosphate dehydratase HisB [Actinomycetota bacterium]